LDKAVEQVRKNPALTSKEVRNEAIRRDYWQAVRNGTGYSAAAYQVAKKYQLGVVSVYKIRNLATRTVARQQG
jgi:Mor family transcriptional regulator